MASAAVMDALRALWEGQLVPVYNADGREEETDTVIAPKAVTAWTV
jgi:3,4-dihydroxy-2-butanone 4-phosphate synthase